MVILPFEIIEIVIEELDAGGSREALRSFARCSKDYRKRLFHRLYKIIVLSNDAQILAFYTFVKGKLIQPLELPRILIELPPNRDPVLEDIMQGLQHSKSLQYLELRERDKRPCPSEFRSLALQIVATAKQHLTMVVDRLDTVTWRYCRFVRHLELRDCSVALDYPPPSSSFDVPLETLTLSTETAMKSLDIFDNLHVRLPRLTHILLYFKPDKEDLEMFSENFSTALSTAIKLEDITIVYEPNGLDTSALAASVGNLVQVLTAASSRRKDKISIHWRFSCSADHVSNLIGCMLQLQFFDVISVSLSGSHADALTILKRGYYFLISRSTSEVKSNKRLRVDRICVSKSRQHTTVYGMTVEDSETKEAISRIRSHDKVCPWYKRHDLGGFEVDWHDTLIPTEDL
ncbi:hypothetical protein CVT26_007578 [Gymnopilus dilepis]|uniref:F-box domain-containing protein n=1 Tax=Gymnopilus dilepis TaxID=231916 RepID=A0A409X2K5_9AGAR|nr:hypothetical protein CVT26_007578 [Gymnopilus dilepis]